jgi:hypothetical protein
MLRLVSSVDAPAPSAGARRRPHLVAIEGGGIPVDGPPEREAWRYAPNGHLLPRTGWRDRIKLPLWHATKAWRAIAKELDAATDAIAAANDEDLDATWETWVTIAIRAVQTPSNSRWALRTKIALASVIAGEPFEHGSRLTSGGQVAFRLLDGVVFESWLDEGRRATDGKGRLSRRHPSSAAKAVTFEAV